MQHPSQSHCDLPRRLRRTTPIYGAAFASVRARHEFGSHELPQSLPVARRQKKPGLTCPGRVGAAKRKVTVGMSRPRNINECIISIDETNRTSHGGTATRLAGRASSWTGVIVCHGGSVAAVHPATADVYYETRRRSGSHYWRDFVGAERVALGEELNVQAQPRASKMTPGVGIR
jgi:hypothetical protein